MLQEQVEIVTLDTTSKESIEDSLQKLLCRPRPLFTPVPLVQLNDGEVISIQAGSLSYAIPRNTIGPYKAVELGSNPFNDTNIEDYLSGDVYPYVPLEYVVNALTEHFGVNHV